MCLQPSVCLCAASIHTVHVHGLLAGVPVGWFVSTTTAQLFVGEGTVDIWFVVLGCVPYNDLASWELVNPQI